MPHQSDVETAVQDAVERGDLEGATSELLRGYGDEVLGFLAGLAGDITLAEDVFSDFCERVWRSLGRFEWRSSLRTWAYAIARNAFRDHLRARHREQRRQVVVSSRRIANVQAEVSTRTRTYLKTATKDRFFELRSRLPESDQVVLLLRVDRDLPWSEIAVVLADGQELGADAVTRRAAALRKRFERIKARLRELAEAEGILPG